MSYCEANDALPGYGYGPCNRPADDRSIDEGLLPMCTYHYEHFNGRK